MEGKKCIVWFRNDLRLHDHTPLTEAVSKGAIVYPVYCLDESLFTSVAHGSLRMGAFRAKFLLESIVNLQIRLREKGCELVFLQGKTEEQIPRFAVEKGISLVLAYKEVGHEEIQIADRLEGALFKQRIRLELFLGNTLFNKEDLPFPIPDVPDTFSLFKKRVEKDSFVRKSLPEPALICADDATIPASIPDLSDFGFSAVCPDPRSAMFFKGGENEGLERLNHYIWQKELIATYKSTRNGLLGADYSSKLSAWLSLGCISPRKVYEEIKKYEHTRIANSSTEWLFYELLWRDYFRFVFKKYGPKLFLEKGIKGLAPLYDPVTEDEHLLRWKQGQTGIPFIDANMTELKLTGFMSNRGRQVAASFLIHDLKVRWRKGAAWFEENLVDYNPASNWGNWAYLAGVGNDPRENRRFNVLKQAYDYDPQGAYVKVWIPSLADIPPAFVHQPWLFGVDGNSAENLNYLSPLVQFKRFEKEY